MRFHNPSHKSVCIGHVSRFVSCFLIGLCQGMASAMPKIYFFDWALAPVLIAKSTLPPLFWHLCFQYFTPKVLCAFDLRVGVNHCFSILCRLARKVFRTKELQVKYSEIGTYSMRTSSLPATDQVLKDRVPPPE